MVFIFTLICESCGDKFESKKSNARYCKYCRNKAQARRNKEYAQKRDANETKPIGSTQICNSCGKEYIQKSGMQKYCSDCQRKQINKQKNKYNTKYKKDNYEQINISVPMGQRDELKAYAQSQGLSLNKLIQIALEEYQKNHS